MNQRHFNDRFAFRRPYRERKSLLPKLAARINEDSFIISDVGKDYIECPGALNFKGHATSNVFAAPNSAVVAGLDPKLGVNYVRTSAEKKILVPSENVDPDEEVEIKVHTNNVKSMWKDLIEHMVTMRGSKYSDRFEVDDCIAEWVYRKNILEEGAVGFMDRGEQLRRFFKDVCRVYPGSFKNGIKDNLENCLCDECQFKQ